MKKLYLVTGVILLLILLPNTHLDAKELDNTTIIYLDEGDTDNVEVENEDEQEDDPSINIEINIKTIANTVKSLEQLSSEVFLNDYLKDTMSSMSIKTETINAIYKKAKDISAAQAKKAVYTVTEKEYDILCHIVEAEATDGTPGQKQNVASNIFTRVESSEWPNSIEKVVFQKGQYSPISDGRYYSVKITESTKKAVDYILENGIIFTDADGVEHTDLRFNFFCSYGCKSSFMAGFDKKLAAKGKECFRDGIHRYYE